MDTGIDREGELSQIVNKALDLIEREGLEALDSFAGKHPAYDDDVRRRVERLAALGLVGESAPAETSFPERLGDFRLLERIGNGGMGVVFEAEQLSLGRRVALKLIRRDLLYSAGTRERFDREVAIISRLQHPGIVAIHTVGEEGGLPYFAMELLQGRSLERILLQVRGRALSALTGGDLARAVGAENTDGYLWSGSWERACLRVARLVADALEHAHERGVFHRDVKPSNVMLTRDGRVQLLDFGLSWDAQSSRMTGTRAQLGTLQYMPPERLAETPGPWDARGDVYSLGVTLYELLTGEAPFKQQTTASTILAVERGEPRSPRELNRSLSWEAATVCLTAMDRDPLRRFATCADLSRDLGRVLAGRPIAARPASLALRSRRWVARHPWKALAVAFAGVLFVGGPIAYSLMTRRHADALEIELERTQVAKRRADSERIRAEEHLSSAVQAVDQLLTRIGDKRLENVPGLGALRRELLEDAVAMYVELEQSGRARDDSGEEAPESWGTGAIPVELRRHSARAHRRLGDLLVNQGELEAARPRLEHAIALVSAGDFEADDPLHPELIRATLDLSKGLSLAGALDEAAAPLVAVIPLAESTFSTDKVDSGLGQDLVMLWNNLSALYYQRGRTSEAEAAIRRAISFQELLPRSGSTQSAQQILLANLNSKLALNLQVNAATQPEARRLHARAYELANATDLKALTKRSRTDRAVIKARWASFLRLSQDSEAAHGPATEGVAELESLSVQFPQDRLLAELLFINRLVAVEVAEALGRPDEARMRGEQAIGPAYALLENSQSTVTLASNLSDLERLLARSCEQLGELDEARDWASRALQHALQAQKRAGSGPAGLERDVEDARALIERLRFDH